MTLNLYLSFLQILLDDVKVSEQLIDLVFYLLVLLGAYRQVNFHFLEVLDPCLLFVDVY